MKQILKVGTVALCSYTCVIIILLTLSNSSSIESFFHILKLQFIKNCASLLLTIHKTLAYVDIVFLE